MKFYHEIRVPPGTLQPLASQTIAEIDQLPVQSKQQGQEREASQDRGAGGGAPTACRTKWRTGHTCPWPRHRKHTALWNEELPVESHCSEILTPLSSTIFS